MISLRRPLDPAKSALPVLALLAASLALPSRASGAEYVKGSQFHARLGMVNGSFSVGGTGASLIQSSFSVMNALDLEYEMFSSRKASWTLRGIFAYETATSLMRYMYGGIGRRYYFMSTGMPIDAEDGGTQVTALPKWRYYFGGDLGISESIARVEGTVLQTNSSMFDFGGNVGTIYQWNKSLGLEVNAGYAFGYGFSSVSFSGTTMRLLFGASYYF